MNKIQKSITLGVILFSILATFQTVNAQSVSVSCGAGSPPANPSIDFTFPSYPTSNPPKASFPKVNPTIMGTETIKTPGIAM